MSDGLKRAIEIAGGTRKLAKKIGISAQAISQWREVPEHQVAAVSRETGIPPAELRPDQAEIYGARRRRRRRAGKH